MNDAASSIKDNKKYNAAREKVKALFREALPSFQKAHELKPDNVEYMIPMRSIYYNLNMSKEYEAMDKLIKSKQ